MKSRNDIYIYLLAAPRGMWHPSSPPGMEPVPPAVEVWSLNHWPPGQSRYDILFFFKLFFIYLFFWLCWVFVAVRGLLSAVASLVAEHRLSATWASVVAACRLSSCGSRAPERRLSSCGARA